MTWVSDNWIPLFQTEMVQGLVISPQFAFFHPWLESFVYLNLVASQQFKNKLTQFIFSGKLQFGWNKTFLACSSW